MKKTLILSLIYALSLYPQSQVNELKEKIDSIYSNVFFNNSIMSVDIYDLTSGQNLFSKNENTLLSPASNLKILTTSAGLLFLGPNYKFKTTFAYTGEILNGTLYGDLFVKGGCDPKFSFQDLKLAAKEISKKDIKEITGNIYGDVSMMDSLFWGNGWMWDDDPSTDAPYLTPLNIDANSINIVVKGSKIGEKSNVELIPPDNFIKIFNKSVTVPSDSPSTLYVNRDWIHRNNNIYVSGNVKLSVPDSLIDTTSINVYSPENYFLSLLKDQLENQGITIDGNNFLAKTPDYAKNIYVKERDLENIVITTNKISYNLGAEMIFYTLAEKYFGSPAHWKNGVKMVDSLISKIGLDPSGYHIVDGSGVSHYNLISTGLILTVLMKLYLNYPDIFKIFYSSLPIAGVDGSLKDRMLESSTKNNVHAKTGSLSGASSLSGYLHSANGHLIAFSIIINNFPGSSKPARMFEDDICKDICNLKF